MSAWRDTPTLVGRHVTLRPLADDDLPALVEAARADDLWDIFYASVSQLKHADRWLAAARADEAAGRALLFAVALPDGKVVGTTRLMRMNEAHRRLDVGGTFYATRVQRTGVNTEAKLLLFGHAFDLLDCRSVQIRTDALNRRSQAAIERIGAKRDGVLRNHQISEGRLRDTVVYSVLDREWPGVRQNLHHLLAKHR
ncbi:GNAT family N-acetyltransferase [Sphingomonas rubra]|uniref:Protein N-acetyltransferase, RimJ/RimL family n=1 Tax=Sphingomonas rubra TaxID=634430 RepID=A0A1I5Q0Y3_9SPHN|nr:GNAT family protein [Sphingomonas rubra]SFP39506.1 Protein N-acetyltransferase, RimJ/RimL family [Sphingomonas rubra]